MQLKTQAVGLYVPVDTVSFDFRGQQVTWRRGITVIEEGNPILRGRSQLVRPLEIDYPAQKRKDIA